MPVLTVQVNYALKNKAPETLTLSTVVDQAQMERLIPPVPSGGSGGWAHWDEAIDLIAPLVKKELFPDETSPVENAADFQRLGVWHLEFHLRNGQNDVLFMTPIRGERWQLPY